MGNQRRSKSSRLADLGGRSWSASYFTKGLGVARPKGGSVSADLTYSPTEMSYLTGDLEISPDPL